MLAARGARNLDKGEEKIEDEASATALREKAKSIRSRSALFALLLTVFSLATYIVVTLLLAL